jgi:hypothetical protein
MEGNRNHVEISKKPMKHFTLQFLSIALYLIVLLVLPACNKTSLSVSTIDDLQSALDNAESGDTIFLQDGIYKIQPKIWAIQISKSNLTIRSKSGNREDVVIEGLGMHAQAHHGFFVRGDNTTIADLTIQNVRNHCVQTTPGVDRLQIQNCILRNAGEQIVKVPTDQKKDPAEGGVIEGCLLEYSAGTGPRYYIGGIDVHNGKDWIVRDNIFKFIRSPGGQIAEHAVHFWNNSVNTLVEKNQIITCDRGIGFGMGNNGHSGGIIRDNSIYHDGSPGFNDVGISLESSPDTQILNNEIYLHHDYANAIECRFPASKNIFISNNIINKAIQMRDGATALLQNNDTSETNAKPNANSAGK